MTYEFVMVAGKGQTSADSIMTEARRIAAVFFGDKEFDLEIQINGRPQNWDVSVAATYRTDE